MDLISDALTKIRNASLTKKEEVVVRKTKTVLGILSILKSYEFIEDCAEGDRDVTVRLKYKDEKPAIVGIKRVSKGGRREYLPASKMRPILSGRGIGIVTTSSGLMTTEQAREKNIGGEHICNIW